MTKQELIWFIFEGIGLMHSGNDKCGGSHGVCRVFTVNPCTIVIIDGQLMVGWGTDSSNT